MTSENHRVETEPLFIELIESRELKSGTIKLYRIALQRYTDYTGMTLEELLDEAELEEDMGVKLRKRKIKKYILGFKQDLDNTDFSEAYKKVLMIKVKSFYNEFEIQLPKIFRRKRRSDNEVNYLYSDLPTMEEISRLLEYCQPYLKPAVLIGLSSGMSRSEIVSLTFKHFYDSIPLEKYPKTMEELLSTIKGLDNIIPLWRVIRSKTGSEYFTFSSPESFDSIVEFLDHIHRKFPDYNPEPKDTLIRNKHNKNINSDTLGLTYRRDNIKAGFKLVDHTKSLPKLSYIRPHVLRKIFASTLEKNKMPHLMTRWLLGHSIDQTTSAYFKADPEAIKNEYIQVLPYLTTNKQKIVVINQYEEIKQELEEIKMDRIASRIKNIKEEINEE